MNRTDARASSRMVAFCAMMAALGTVIMLSGGLIPVFTYCSPLLASVLLIPVMDEYDAGKGWMVWAVTAALSLLIGVDKEASFFYLFLGWYQLLKPAFDRAPSKVGRFLIKTLIFSSSVGIMYALLCFVFQIGEILESFAVAAWVNILFFATLVAVMLLFDRTLAGLHLLYQKRIRQKMKGS